MHRRRRLRLSVRLAVTFGVGALLVSTLLASTTYFLSRRYLAREQEHTALRQAYFNAAVIRTGMQAQTPDVPALLDLLPSGIGTSALIEQGGRWYSTSLTVSRDGLPAAVKQPVLNGQVVQAWIRTNGAPALTEGIPLPSVDGAFFQITDEAALSRTLGVLRAVLAAAAAAATLAGALVGWLASRRLTAPLRSVAAAAERIAVGDFQTSLPPETDVELGGLVESFNTMVDALKERIERDARFAGDVSHELRSPLTTLSTALSVLQGRRNELSPRGADALNLLSGEVQRFQRLVEDLLEISRADEPGAPVDREAIRICELVLQVLGEGRYGEVTTDIDSRLLDATVDGDKRRLEQALRNLLDNAQRHGGGIVRVAVEPLDDAVAVVVDDMGPGVPLADVDRIFDRFARGGLSRRRGSQGGTGLGLAIVREHVRWHGGHVVVRNRPGGGARFQLELPTSGAH
ncbi:MAG TPA: HAMP domain-containing sensor histidine kinase [Mycobacteriales bacterium]|nr:HAMP domain-containing sensor histidine kinase [Mycobacteriales bacterium]